MKPDILTLIDTSDGKPVATLGVAAYDGRKVIKRDGSEKVMRFSSGKLGFYAGGKVQIDGKTYQCSCSFVEITPKNLNGGVSEFSAAQIAEMNSQRSHSSDDDELERLTRPE